MKNFIGAGALFMLGAIIGAACIQMAVVEQDGKPVAATAIFVCDNPEGVLVTKRNGETDWIVFGDDKLMERVTPIPKKQRNTIKFGGPYCREAAPTTF